MLAKHFKPHITESIADKMKLLADSIEERFADIDSYGVEPIVNTIEGLSRDGYWAHQDGGYEVSMFTQNDIDKGCHLTEEQSAYNDKQNEQCWKDFLSDNELEENVTYDDLTEKQQNDLQDMESEYFEPALLRMEIWIDDNNDNGQDVFMRLSINYKDQPYYRSKYDEAIFQETLELNEFMESDIAQLTETIMKSIT